jgi:hypothetical protein
MCLVLLLKEPGGEILPTLCDLMTSVVDQFKQTWTSMIENSSKGNNYKLFKHDLKFEDYLDVLDDKDKFLLVKFKTSNYRSWALA